MSAVRAECPGCESSVLVDEDAAGRVAVCGRCRAPLVVEPIQRLGVPSGAGFWLAGGAAAFLGAALISALVAAQSVPRQAPDRNMASPAGRDEQKDLTPEKVFEAVRSAAVLIHAESRDGQSISQGSGFFVHPAGWVVTNAHVIDGAAEILLRTDSGREVAADRVAIDEQRDLALLRVNLRGVPVIRMARENPSVGASVYAIGSPRGLENSFTAGIVSGIREDADVTWVQSTASISPGSSGGALVDGSGALVGVTTAGAPVEFANDLFFSVSVEDVLRFLRRNGVKVTSQ